MKIRAKTKFSYMTPTGQRTLGEDQEGEASREDAVRFAIQALAAPVGWKPTPEELRADALELHADLEAKRGAADPVSWYRRPDRARALRGIAAAVGIEGEEPVSLLSQIGEALRQGEDRLWGVANEDVRSAVRLLSLEELRSLLTEYAALEDRARETAAACERTHRELTERAVRQAWEAGQGTATAPDTSKAQEGLLAFWLGRRLRRRLGVPDTFLAASFAMQAVNVRVGAIRDELTRRYRAEGRPKALEKLLSDAVSSELAAAEIEGELVRMREVYSRVGLIARGPLELEIQGLAAKASTAHRESGALLDKARAEYGWTA